MTIKLYNTLTKEKEEFKPLEGNTVRIYSCGPTVYNYAHIGNFRTYVFMDTLRRLLKYNGYKLKHVMNITDVGHLESDADEGEDKMEKAARKENKNPYEIAKYYSDIFFRDMERLNIDKPEIIAKATEHIADMLEFVEGLMKNGYAYETSKGIYFDISKLDKYPVLSNRKIDEQIAGARVDVDEEKRSPYDFALWIKAPANHIMKWESPWGLSYPGWHIECSAMSRKYLGDQFDIHTGGIDHIPTHHENEIAQSKGLTGKIPAKFWMHVEFLQVDGGKMSKSLGNTYTLDQLLEKGIEPLAYKLFCFTAHYRTKLNFTFETALSSQTALNRLREGFIKHQEGTEIVPEEKIKEYEDRFLATINDDLNMPSAMGIVWEIIRNSQKSKQYAELLLKFDEVLGLDLLNSKKYLEEEKKVELPEEILELIEKRKKARENKDWALSDQIRDVLKEKGYSVKDTKDGMDVEKISARKLILISNVNRKVENKAVEEENKISFWKKIKISILGLEDYQKLATQKIGKTVGYLAKLMLIFVFVLSLVLTYRFSTAVGNVKQYIQNELSQVHFENSTLTITANENAESPIVIEDEELLNGKLIIDTNDLTEEQINNYTEDVSGYTNGIVILKDKIIIKVGATAAVSTTVLFSDIAEQYNIVKLDKQDIINMLSGSNIYMLYTVFFIIMYFYLFIIYFSTVLIDALLYSLLGYITATFSRLRLRYSAIYNIAVHALTLPIILNLVYMVANLLTGYTIKYFDIMYLAITCIYIITAILMIKSDIIKKQMELSRIISEQEKLKQEMARKEQEKREEEEREKVRKEDEKKRKEEKEKSQEGDNKEEKPEEKSEKKEKKKQNDKNTPQPEANIVTRG